MRRVLIVLLVLHASLTFAAPQRGANLLKNPGFEETKEGRAAGWSHVGEGYALAQGGAKEGQVSECEICGTVVVVKAVGGGELVCCGEPMKLIEG